MVPELVFPGERVGDLSSGSPGDLHPLPTGTVLSAAVPEPSNARLTKSGGTAETNRAEQARKIQVPSKRKISQGKGSEGDEQDAYDPARGSVPLPGRSGTG